MRTIHVVVASCGLAALSSGAFAQCNYQTSLLDTWDRVGVPAFGATQHVANGWTFLRSDSSVLLVGVLNFSIGTNSWGAPDQSFLIPMAGPRYSNIAARNQNAAHRRTPSFEGLMLHPGNTTAIDAQAVIRPQATVTLTSMTLKAEMLGNASPNVVVTVELVTPGGTTVLIPATSITALAAAQTLTPAGGLPVVINPTDQLILSSDNGGSSFEDWLNTNLTLGLSGPPLIVDQPRDVQGCPGSAITLRVVAAGAASYQWRRDGSDLSGETAETITLPPLSLADAGSYECVVTNSCGSVTTASALVRACLANYNCDSELDILDFLDFIDDFGNCENQPAPCGNTSNADVNGDTVVDILDFLDFIDSFGTGCA